MTGQGRDEGLDGGSGRMGGEPTMVEDELQTTAVIGSAGGRRGMRRPGGKRRHGPGADVMVPEADFTSYYGRPIVKAAPWEDDIPAYLFSGGLAAGSALIAAGADLTGRPHLRRTSRVGALVALSFSGAALVHDLGKPSRFLNMLRVAKLTSPMSVGTWIITAYAPGAGIAGLAELVELVPAERRGGAVGTVSRLLGLLSRPAGLWAAAFGPPLAAYTAVLLSDTATPSWHEAYRELPFVFVGSAAAASAGLGLMGAPTHETGPVRRLAVGAAVLELAAEHRMERSMGITVEPLHEGRAGRLMRASKALTVAGAAGALLSGRSRALAVLSGAALMAGSACTRFGVFEAGIASANDPKYTVVPQRERLQREGPIHYQE